MRTYKSEADIKGVLMQISSRLSEIEVKGNSVELPFASRVILKELFEKIEEEDIVKESNKKEERD